MKFTTREELENYGYKLCGYLDRGEQYVKNLEFVISLSADEYDTFRDSILPSGVRNMIPYTESFNYNTNAGITFKIIRLRNPDVTVKTVNEEAVIKSNREIAEEIWDEIASLLVDSEHLDYADEIEAILNKYIKL